MDMDSWFNIILQVLFGITQSRISKDLAFCTHILLVVLQQMDDARVKRLSDGEIHLFKEAVKSRHPRLDGVS